MQQMLVALHHPASPLLLAAMALPVTLVLPILSWHLVEQLGLAQRQVLGRWAQGACANT
ncbi:hypothetical protein [Novosphingobium sp.]|uniref:hypothetical protein n=1 Tax=Novosphingobium sp. TaxID=1874826 RepID=UPI001D28CCFE|nr:hypothetical protein [Novosphingobium sp.]MBX9665326.1 hypothetical protein [Novosphingobium sp.]